MTSHGNYVFAASAAVALIAAGPAQAQSVSKTIAKSGPFMIDHIKENGRFDRCAATLNSGSGKLRIALTKGGKFSISTPPAAAAKGVPLLMTFNLPNGVLPYNALTDGQRAWATVDSNAIAGLQRTRGNLAIEVGTRKFVWNVGNVTMDSVFSAIESCATQP